MVPDNLRESVLKLDIYDPTINPVYDDFMHNVLASTPVPMHNRSPVANARHVSLVDRWQGVHGGIFVKHSSDAYVGSR